MPSDSDYKAMARRVNPYVSWDLSRRRTFTSPERAKISRAHNALSDALAGGLTVRRVRRSPGESEHAYRRRLAALKRANGMAGSPLAAVAVRTSSTETVSVRGARAVVRSTLTGRRQWFIAFDPVSLAADTEAECARVFDLAMDEGATTVAAAIGSRRTRSYDSYSDVDDFTDSINDIVSMYPAADLRYILTGIVAMRGGGTRI